MFPTLTVASTTTIPNQCSSLVKLPYPSHWRPKQERVTVLELITFVASSIPQSLASMPLNRHSKIGQTVQAFQAGSFYVFLDNLLLHDIAEVVDIYETSRIIFVRNEQPLLIV